MELLREFIKGFEFFIAFYSFTYLTIFFIFLILAAVEIKFFFNHKHILKYKEFLDINELPGISIVAPAFNEEVTIVENVTSLLNLDYPKYEVVLVNDGSTDSTLDLLIAHFELVKVEKFYIERIKSKPVRGFYKSTNPKFSKLLVVDKVNGGCKADATNAGINISKYEYFVSTDVDCILRKDALFVMLKPFITSRKKVLAVGAGIKAVNNSIVENGVLVENNFPESFFPIFQEIEYTRSFVFGRMAMSKINSLVLVSGGLGMFDKQTVIEAGGYYHTSLAEDLDMVLRMRKVAYDNKMDHEVVYVPETLCWTEVPPNREVFIKQRARWGRGLMQTLIIHKDLFFNSKYGKTGMIAYPYFFFFELVTPVIEVIGIIVLILDFIFFEINYEFFLKISLIVYLYYVFINFMTIYADQLGKLYYKSIKQILRKLFFVMLEPIVYHPIALYSTLKGYYLYLFNKEQKWGKMTRKGFLKRK